MLTSCSVLNSPPVVVDKFQHGIFSYPAFIGHVPDSLVEVLNADASSLELVAGFARWTLISSLWMLIPRSRSWFQYLLVNLTLGLCLGINRRHFL